MSDAKEPAAAAPPAEPPSDDPPLGDAERAFDAGDWRRAGDLARRALSDAAVDEPGRAAARALLDRLRPDPQLVALYLASLLVFALSVLAWVRR